MKTTLKVLHEIDALMEAGNLQGARDLLKACNMSNYHTTIKGKAVVLEPVPSSTEVLP